MKEIKYSISMFTPIGMKRGIMFATMNENQISGTMELLEHKEPFDGIIEKNGECKIRGRLISLMRTIEYTASGKITPSTVQLLLRGERNTFEISGKALAMEGEKMYV